MLSDFCLGIVHIDLGGLGEHLRRTGGILDDEMRHHADSCHLVESAGHKVVELLVSGFLDEVGAGLELVGHGLYPLKQRLHLLRALDLLVVAQGGEV